jgi:hypothetical protein
MPYCPKCKKKYSNEIKECPVCRVPLTANPLSENDDSGARTVLLCQTNDLVSAEILEETLKSQGIPFLVKSYMGSFSSLMPIDQVMKGVKIYVPESALSKASDIAATIMPDFERQGDDE